MYQYTREDVAFLEQKAAVLRKDIIEMIHDAGAGHPGGSLSAVEIVTALYFHVMNIDPQNPQWPDRDRFVLSKGHACPVLYAALAERGYFGKEHLKTLRKYRSILQGHPDMRKTPGVDMTSGSLGNGMSAALGMALAAGLDRRDYMVYALVGDGEIQEGIVWEAAMAAGHYRLDNFTVIVDYNGIQINGWTNDVIRVQPVDEKFKAFGWSVIEIDGHDMGQILAAFHRAKKMRGPVAILAHTVKGKGVSFMEDNAVWHGKAPSDEEAERAIAEIEKEGVF